ncbi:Lrp/AsnC family transcriptional regulator [Sphingobium sp. DEHP117]|uniref:Lrp/AsnC family transcriptional regulator n=1 Tax=Sphingobium sp. DEHP117 TaxID=2993436 RepID=UPI0027D6F66E|nr:Lrp/AsnC ligand binding domain-containing protein [Sphingobium sp. DEHP117]MDQ4421403.1 Lrp/AsnC family transcriptional regulator [Sphingobium sp. DEHP117]
MLPELDSYDRLILSLLQADSSRSNADIASAIGLSEAPCWRRVQRLKKEGYIKAQVSLLDREKLGLNIQVFALIKLTAVGRSNLSDFAREISEFPEVLECYVVMGNSDFLLRIVASNVQAYEHFMFEKLSQVPGVQEINSLTTLSEIKVTTQLPIGA